jgi:hypothetical protein
VLARGRRSEEGRNAVDKVQLQHHVHLRAVQEYACMHALRIDMTGHTYRAHGDFQEFVDLPIGLEGIRGVSEVQKRRKRG